MKSGSRSMSPAWELSKVKSSGCDPFLKWAGGKRRLADEIIANFGEFSGRYFEPFLGGGAVFFRFQPKDATLSDVNPELIECYEVVKNRPVDLAARLCQMVNSADEYYRIRSLIPRTSLGRAARFVYLTSLSFNGIYRQNLRGKFNVPYGWKVAKSLPSLEEIKRASVALRSTELCCADFSESTRDAGPGDVVYFDPPYTVAHNNNGFVKYNAAIFSWEDQERLAATASALVKRGSKVLVSNANHPSVAALYSEFEVRLIRRPSVIAAASQFRLPVTECLFVSRAS